jgi:hypothetical protein
MVEGNESASGGSGSQGGGGWSEGGSVGNLSSDQAKAEIKSLEADENFAGDGRMDYWSRQKMLRRRDALYRAAYPEKINKPYDSMSEVLVKQGVNEETIQEAKGKLQDYVDELHQKRADKVIREKWGNDTDREEKFVSDFVVKNTSKEFQRYLNDTRLGDDPNVVFFAHSLANLVKEYPEASFIIPALERSVREYAEGVRRKVEKTELTKRGGRGK